MCLLGNWTWNFKWSKLTQFVGVCFFCVKYLVSFFFFSDAPSIPTRTQPMPNTWNLAVVHSPFMVRWVVQPQFLVSLPLQVGRVGVGPWLKPPWPWGRKRRANTNNRWSKCLKTPLILLKKWKNGKCWPMAIGCQMELVPEKMVRELKNIHLQGVK